MADSFTPTQKITEQLAAGGFQFKAHEPSSKEKEVIGVVFQLFRTSSENRNRTFDYFDNRTLTDVIDASVIRFITNKDERTDIEDWQARVNDPFTRNKTMAILGRVADNLPRILIQSFGEEDVLRASILTSLYDYTDTQDDNEELMFNALLEALVKGTVVGYEGYEEYERDVRDVVKYDSADELTTKDGKVKVRRLFGAIVSLEDFYPSSVGIRKIKDMPYCFWRTEMTHEEFVDNFGHYDKASVVNPFFSIDSTDSEGARPFYLDYITDDIGDGNVEVIRYYNALKDEFVIIGNGVWLNPVSQEEDIMPLPFNHKRLPFWSAIYEPLGADFFYGKSLPDKLSSSQDVLNVLHNMMLDQSFLSIFPPILTSGIDDIEDDYLRPGRRIPVLDPNNYKELQISTPDNFHQFILNYTKRVLEETSIDAVSQGVAGVGDRVTAREINQAAEGVASVLGLFVQFVKWGIKDKARLRANNILQFYKKPIIEGVLGEGGTEDFNRAFNTFTVDGVELTGGRRGVRIIEVFQNRENLPTKVEQQTSAKILEKESGKRIEKIAITPEFLREGFHFDIELTTSTDKKQAINKALFIEYVRVATELFPDLLNREAAMAELTLT